MIPDAFAAAWAWVSVSAAEGADMFAYFRIDSDGGLVRVPEIGRSRAMVMERCIKVRR